MYNYETIKELAKDNKQSVKDLLALSPNNDPFYVGSAGQMEKAKWFADVYKQMGSPRECHIRRVHYWIVSKALKKSDGSVYENTEEDWGFLTMCAKYARYAGFVPIENMIDKRNPPAIQHANYWDNEVPTEIKESIDAEDIKLKQIVLTAEQCKKYKLPRTPIKATERRKQGFEGRFGVGATELDALEALHSGELRRIISSEVTKFLDIDLINEVIEKNNELSEKVKTFLKGKITNVLEKLDVSEFDEFEPEKADTIDDSDEDWIYDSSLDYEEQIGKYKKFQSKEE